MKNISLQLIIIALFISQISIAQVIDIEYREGGKEKVNYKNGTAKSKVIKLDNG